MGIGAPDHVSSSVMLVDRNVMKFSVLTETSVVYKSGSWLHMVDNDLTTGYAVYHSATTMTLQFDMQRKRYISLVALFFSVGFPSGVGVDYDGKARLQYSDDASTWTDIDTTTWTSVTGNKDLKLQGGDFKARYIRINFYDLDRTNDSRVSNTFKEFLIVDYEGGV